MFPETNNWLHFATVVSGGSSTLRQLQLHIAGKLGVGWIRAKETSYCRVPLGVCQAIANGQTCQFEERGAQLQHLGRHFLGFQQLRLCRLRPVHVPQLQYVMPCGPYMV
ncbi:MAG: hypothetical protein FRX49_05567 [Trebouxia sp. A1-2]|nr:MAG: hypothetical protein FRX49_05567 [Trebouxia sp. A1-2]